jgi:hypothetical protein
MTDETLDLSLCCGGDEADPHEPDIPEVVMFGPGDDCGLDVQAASPGDLPFPFSNAHAIPYSVPQNLRQPVVRGWKEHHDYKPVGVTWHWAVCTKLEILDRVIGGPRTSSSADYPRSDASAHYGIGKTFAEGVSRYVSIEDCSWHAGAGQKMRWDGAPFLATVPSDKGSRCCIGIEIANMGHAYRGDHGSKVLGTAGDSLDVDPWTVDQLAMCIHVGKEIVDRWPHIRPEHHHGHHDLCPGRKEDVASFPFALVLRGIYDDATIRDVWTPLWSALGRQRALLALGGDLGKWGADGAWGGQSRRALLAFQEAHGLQVNGQWTSHVCRAMDAALLDEGLELTDVVADPD